MIISKTVAQPNYEELLQKEEVKTNNTKQQSWDEVVSPGVLIIDCGAISNIDTMGVEAIKEVHNISLF